MSMAARDQRQSWLLQALKETVRFVRVRRALVCLLVVVIMVVVMPLLLLPIGCFFASRPVLPLLLQLMERVRFDVFFVSQATCLSVVGPVASIEATLMRMRVSECVSD